jgi:hypothetical protein
MLWQRLNAVLVLLTFLVSGSGWVLHRHYCPVSQEQVISLLQQKVCAGEEEPAADLASCCAMEEAASCCTAPLEPAEHRCGEERDCCQDEIILLELRDPFTANPGLALHAPLTLPAPAAVFAAFFSAQQQSTTVAAPEPPPPFRRSLDRLNALQVYRT